MEEKKKVYTKKPFNKNRKPEKYSMKKQAERKRQPIPHTMEQWAGHRGLIEYAMPRGIAENLLNSRKGKEKGIDPQKYLCDYVNEELNLIGYCVKVIIE